MERNKDVFSVITKQSEINPSRYLNFDQWIHAPDHQTCQISLHLSVPSIYLFTVIYIAHFP